MLDVNVGTTIANALRQAGHDVIRTALETPKARDAAILAWAASDNRVLITYDNDFTDLIFRDLFPPPPAVIYIRGDPIGLELLASRIVSLTQSGLLFEHIHIVDGRMIRRRRFPEINAND